MTNQNENGQKDRKSPVFRPKRDIHISMAALEKHRRGLVDGALTLEDVQKEILADPRLEKPETITIKRLKDDAKDLEISLPKPLKRTSPIWDVIRDMESRLADFEKRVQELESLATQLQQPQGEDDADVFIFG